MNDVDLNKVIELSDDNNEIDESTAIEFSNGKNIRDKNKVRWEELC